MKQRQTVLIVVLVAALVFCAIGIALLWLIASIVIRAMIAHGAATAAADETIISIAGPAGEQLALFPEYTGGWVIVTLPSRANQFYPDPRLSRRCDDASVSDFYACDDAPIVCGRVASIDCQLDEEYFIITLSETEPIDPRKTYVATYPTREELARAWEAATGSPLPADEPHDIWR